MTGPTVSQRLDSFTAQVQARPVPPALHAARDDVQSAVDTLRLIPEERLAAAWPWKGGSEEEVRYAFYRIAESFELAELEAADLLASRGAALARGRAGDLIAPATAARWELEGVLVTLDDVTWDAPPGGDEWTVRRTVGHIISSQRAYGLGTGWWLTRRHARDDPALPPSVPDEVWEAIPEEEAEGDGTPEEARARLAAVLDGSTERLAALTPADLELGARWSGFAVDIGFRLGRWGSHIREHTIQVEKTLAMLGHRPSEVDRLVRHLLATWGRAEAAVYGHQAADGAIEPLARACRTARDVAADAVRYAVEAG